MRVITGSAKGRRLYTLEGKDVVRPTSDKVKEAIFSAIQFDIEGRRILDLFSGSGQLGIEALSRGAASAVFVDSAKASIDVTKKNLEITGLTDRASIICSDYSTYLTRSNEIFDIVFLDPPYKAGILADALIKVIPKLSDYGCVFCEHPSNIFLLDNVENFSVFKKYKFGGITVTMYKKVF